MKTLLNLLISSLLCGTASVHASNETDSSADYFSMSLEELLNVKISVATKTEQNLSLAPSSVTVFDHATIQRMGVENVYDLLNYVPGFQVTRAVDLAGESRINARGVSSEKGHVLVMINGQRLNETYFGRATLYNRYLVTHNVKRVEVIRGPGSAIYGSNAFLGVVNIITEEEKNNVRIQAGEHNYYAIDGMTHFDIAEGITSSLLLSYQGQDGQDYGPAIPGGPQKGEL